MSNPGLHKLTDSLEQLSWPMSRLGEALAELARQSGLGPCAMEVPAFPQGLSQTSPAALDRWIEASAERLGFESQAAEVAYADCERFVSVCGPALLRLPGKGEQIFLAILRGGRRDVLVLGSDLAPHRVPRQLICAALCNGLDEPFRAEVERLLEVAEVRKRHRERARATILRERLGAARLGGCWLLRTSPGASFWNQLRAARLPGRLFLLVSAHTLQYLLWLLSWWLVGRWALQGRLDRGWLLAWALVLFGLVPFRLIVTWSQGLLAVGAGAMLKRRLLSGALRLKPEEIRHEGVGQLLGRVIESEAVESLAFSGGFLALVALIELILAGAVLRAGAGGWLTVLLLGGWLGFTAWLGWRYFRRRAQWTHTRMAMTNHLVESMTGHRTRLTQQPRARWHDGEDDAMENYTTVSKAMDRGAAALVALVPGGWLLWGLLGFGPAFVFSNASSVSLAIGLGGLLLAFRAFQKLALGGAHLAGAVLAWQQVAPLFHAAARPRASGSPTFALHDVGETDGDDDRQPLVEAQEICFRYRDRGEAVLRRCNLRIQRGDRLLLEGGSGAGKSTLASILTGLRQPQSGLLLLRGLDWKTLGEANWRQRATVAPQFHENHVLTGTLLFNLLMGRRWPPLPQDFQQAEALCRELGLGDLLERMPAGLLQIVGETGWQLSQGEKSRLYIARALLQDADLLVLDESFASLDPLNLQRALHCVLARAPTLLVIAHT